jgi:uncharacterized damage-inducible protein DinB
MILFTQKETIMSSRINDSKIALDTLCWFIEDAFDGDLSHSVMSNLKNIQNEDWIALPSGAGRSIADILEHVGWCKWMYEDYAFGLKGDQPPLIPSGGLRSRPHEELLDWLKEGHNQWLASVRALRDDHELERERLTNWGEHLPTHNIIRIMIGHDYYHAGEINHLRSLLQGTDRWEYE